MKNKKLFEAMAGIDDEYILEAEPRRKANQRVKPPYRRYLSIAACVLLLIGLNLWLFIPFRTSAPSISRYSESEYFAVIQKINSLAFQKPKYKNNFDKIFTSLSKAGGIMLEDGVDINAPTADAEPGTDEVGESYVEVTDNQTEGVIESDIYKRTDKHIFYYANGRLLVYEIAEQESKKISETEIYGTGAVFMRDGEMYLSPDGKTVTLVGTSSYAARGAEVLIVTVDVSSPDSPKEKGRATMSGGLITTRFSSEGLLVISVFVVYGKPDFDDEATFLPQIDTGTGKESISADCIVLPENATNTRYTVVTKLSPDTLESRGSYALLSYTDGVYVSADSVYVASGYSVREKVIDGEIISGRFTDISKIDYSEQSLSLSGTYTVNGYIKDQYSLDEYNGILRVVTSTAYSKGELSPSDKDDGALELTPSHTEYIESASLYCIDVKTGEVVGSVLDFAPKGETVESVRFDKSVAYVCTARVVTLTDPVFFFDLSDLNNITYKDTGEIEGYSSSLINLGEGFLLGIGVGDERGSLKIEVYEESEGGVRSVCAYELPYADYSTYYKSYYVDRENNLIGLGVYDYTYDLGNKYDDKERERYILLYFDGYELREIINTELSGQPIYKRGVLIDGYFYMLSPEEFKVVDCKELF